MTQKYSSVLNSKFKGAFLRHYRQSNRPASLNKIGVVEVDVGLGCERGTGNVRLEVTEGEREGLQIRLQCRWKRPFCS